MHFIGTDQMHGWHERIGRDVAITVDDSPLRNLAAEADPARRVEPYVEDLQDKFDCHEFFKVKIGEDATMRDARRATAAYYGMVEMADRQYARVINRLEELDVLDDFIFIFLSDHGEMLGQKGLWHKLQFFEAAARVPFSITAPRILPKVECVATQNVSLVDLFPTLCELVDVPIPDGLDGRSLVPLMQGNADGWPNEVSAKCTTN